jgi:hypothetical protein
LVHLLDLDENIRASFAHAARLTTAEVAGLLLLNLTSRYLPLNRDLDGQPRRLRGIVGQERWVFTKFTRCCPDCLAGDHSVIQQRHGGPWKNLWRLPVVFACVQHGRLLNHVCPACQQPIFRATTLIPRALNAELHPAQCRATAGGPSARGIWLGCGARLDVADPSPTAPAALLAVQRKILNLLDPHGPATTASLGHQISPINYFNDLRILAGLISASWPAALDLPHHPPLAEMLDSYLHDRRQRINQRLQHKRRPPEIVLHGQPPHQADACAPLVALADQILTADDHEQAGQHVRMLAERAPLGPAWARRVAATGNGQSPGTQAALKPTLDRWAKPTVGTTTHRTAHDVASASTTGTSRNAYPTTGTSGTSPTFPPTPSTPPSSCAAQPASDSSA